MSKWKEFLYFEELDVVIRLENNDDITLKIINKGDGNYSVFKLNYLNALELSEALLGLSILKINENNKNSDLKEGNDDS